MIMTFCQYYKLGEMSFCPCKIDQILHLVDLQHYVYCCLNCGILIDYVGLYHAIVILKLKC